MIMLVLNIVKKLAPVLLILGLFAAAYWQGYHAAERRGIETQAKIAAVSNQLIADSKRHNADIQAQAEQSAQIIGETYEKNHKAISDLAVVNAGLVAKLRQRSAAVNGKNRVPSTTSTANFSNADNTGAGKFFESTIDQARIADEVTETARACQEYVKNLQETFK